MAEYHKLDCLNNIYSFSPNSGAEISEIMVPMGLFSTDTFLPGLHIAPFSLFLHMACFLSVCRELSGISSYKYTNPTQSVPHPYDLV